MAWTAPMTFVSGTALTASQMNTYVRDNLNETAPAKATTPGYHFVTSAANQIAERPIKNHVILTKQSTSSTSWTDLTTVGPTVTATTGSMALVIISAEMEHGTADNSTQVAVEVSGASSISPDDNSYYRMISDGNPANSPNRQSVAHLETGLTSGSNTFTMKYRVVAGTGHFKNREIIVIGL